MRKCTEKCRNEREAINKLDTYNFVEGIHFRGTCARGRDANYRNMKCPSENCPEILVYPYKSAYKAYYRQLNPEYLSV